MRSPAFASFRIGMGFFSLGSLVLLLLSFLAPLTETWRWSVSTSLYAMLRSFCHQVPSHCLWYANSNFGVCSHCFGILLGVATMGGFLARSHYPVAYLGISIKRAAWVLGVGLVPLILDVFVHIYRQTMNPHWVRVLTSAVAGGGAIFFVGLLFLEVLNHRRNEMKTKILIVTLITLTICPPQLLIPMGHAEETRGVVLQRGTPIHLRLTQMISSETSHLGDMVHLEVLRDVVVNGKVVIEAGTPADGEIVVASDRGFIGQPGRIGIAVRSTATRDNQPVSLRSTLHREGEDKQTLSLVLGLILCWLFLFMKGEEATIGTGSEVKGYVDGDVTVAV